MSINEIIDNIKPGHYKIAIDLLLRYIKNQERQMNYWLLYKDLELNKFSDEVFDKEIDDNGDRYVIPAGRKDISHDEIYVATQLVQCIGQNAEDNFYEFFEFDIETINRLIAEIENNK